MKTQSKKHPIAMLLIAGLAGAGYFPEAIAEESHQSSEGHVNHSALIKEQPHAIYHVIKAKTLMTVASDIANRSGITFRIDEGVKNDVITKKLAAENWSGAMAQLLQDYNYTVELANGDAKRVIVTGKKSDGASAAAAIADAKDNGLIVVSTDYNQKIPASYQRFNKGSVMPVKLPMDEIRSVKEGESIAFDLPIGQFNVKHDGVSKGNNSSTWSGYMEDEGQGYRVHISQGANGAVMGNIYTPDGEYNIDTVNGQTVLVDIQKSGLSAASYEHDEADPAIAGEGIESAPIGFAGSAPIGAATTAIATDPVAIAKSTAESARQQATAYAKAASDALSAYKVAQASTVSANALTAQKGVALAAATTSLSRSSNEASAANAAMITLTKSTSQLLANHNANVANVNVNAKKAGVSAATLTALKNTVTTSYAAYTQALAKLNAAQSVASQKKASLAKATQLLSAAKLSYGQASTAGFAAQSKEKQLGASYTTANANAVKYEDLAKKAEAAYTTQLAQASKTSTPTVGAAANSVIDVMVIYTTASQTADYAKQRIQYLIDATNKAYKDSGINTSLRLVHARPSKYVETNDNTQALYDLTADNGAFAGIAAARNQYGADLVIFLRPLYIKSTPNCGVAFIGFANGGQANANYGYGVVSDGYSKEPGTASYCRTATFAHEVGHLQGNVHDREFAGATQGRFDYSYAWGINNKFGSVMSYYGPSVMLFSTPNLPTQCNGSPCGFAAGTPKSSDQAKTINVTAPIISGYRAKTTTTPVIQ